MRYEVRAVSHGRSVHPVAWLALLCLFDAHTGHAQELEPRAYTPSPVGTNFVVLGATHSSGGVLFDASLPVSNVEARLAAPFFAYGRTFSAFGHAASATLSLPYVVGNVSGDVGEDRRELHRSGLADARLRFALDLRGGTALTPAQFARRSPRTNVGASLTIVAPSGQYDPRKLINIGANRWSMKAELGVSHPLGHWIIDGAVGAWMFTDNTDSYGGVRRAQAPIATIQGHVSYTIRPRLWLALNATYYKGGETTVGGMRKADMQSNSRIGLTLSAPVGARQSLKFTWSEGATTRIGTDFISFGVAWQYVWFDSK
jgi:hypothetical protein